MPYVEWGWSELGDMPHGHGRMVLLQGLNGKVIMAGGDNQCASVVEGGVYEGLWGCGVCAVLAVWSTSVVVRARCVQNLNRSKG